MIGAAVALAAAGLLRVDGVLIALGLAAAILAGLAWAVGRWNLRRIDVALEGPPVAQAGEELRFAIRVTNPRRLIDAFALRLQLIGPGGLDESCSLPWVAAGSDAAGEVRAVIPDRGAGDSVEARITSIFPCGLFRFERRLRIPHGMLILPRPVVPPELLEGAGSRNAGDRRRPGYRETMGELRGLRDYRPGDPAKLIAWPSSLRSTAQGGGVLVREMDPPGFQPERVVLIFHSYGADGALIRPDRFERAVSLAWGSVRHLQSKRVPVVWIADFEEWVPREIDGRTALGQLGEALARAKRSKGTEAHEVEARLADFRGEVLLVSDMPPSSWCRLTAEVPGSKVIDVTRYEKGLSLKGGTHA
ncbi:hypothetical protein HAHE_28280 [Haloferula helveola]|uniref:DUF58 domain-containing protein n=1 Tax=Haloferula helveola TaxID=490095 RepID=A0ABM7RED1_9BACT|nr:hypothetical protein HAHE_28280 [Haloferula helveola]